MQSKSLLIAIAAFALTATGVQAYGSPAVLSRAGMSEEQIEAVEEARELRKSGKFTEARDVLVEAGIDEDSLRAMRRAQGEQHKAMINALESGDYEQFREAISGSPLADIVTSEEDFEQFRDAHALRAAGEHAEADEIFSDLGIVHESGQGKHNSTHRGRQVPVMDLTTEQQEALRAARQANDRATIQAIFDEAGLERGVRCR